MDIKTSSPSYGIAIMGDYCINCEGYIQYYIRREDGKYSIHTAVDRGYCCTRQCITRPGNRCKHHQKGSEAGAVEAISEGR